MKATGIILGAGMSSRMNGINKQLLSIGGIPVIIRSALNFQNTDEISEIIIATKPDDIDEIKKLCEEYGITKLKAVCEGGDTRYDSAKKAFALSGKTDIVAIHDGARPFAAPELISMVIKDARIFGGAIAAIPVKDTIKVARNDFVESTLDRRALYAAQTPQAFTKELYEVMLYSVTENDVTDDAQLMERFGKQPIITMGSYDNIKITTPEDIPMGEAIAKRYDKC